MTDKTAINAPAIAVLPLLLIWMAAILPFYHPNMGGGGLALPQNILAWSAMALTTLLVTATVCVGRARLSLTPTARLLLLGIAVLALPLLYTRAEWREDALWRAPVCSVAGCSMSPACSCASPPGNAICCCTACCSP
ncbi:TPA: hypothetical protein ACKQAF_004529 [Serratia marcescens]